MDPARADAGQAERGKSRKRHCTTQSGGIILE